MYPAVIWTNTAFSYCVYYGILWEAVLSKQHVTLKDQPTTGHKDPEVEQMYSSSLSLTLALYGGG